MFGCIKTAQVRRWIRWWHHISSNLRSHVCAEQLFQCGKKCVYVEEYEGFSSEQATNIPNGDLSCGCHFHWTITTQVLAETISGTWSAMFDHKRDLVTKWFWPVFIIELSNTDMRLSQRMCFVLGMISGSLVSWESSLFRWICSLLQPLILKCFLGRNRILVTHLRWKTTHHTWW